LPVAEAEGKSMNSDADIQTGGSPVFWGEIAPCEHIAQFYEDDGVLLDTLAGFVGGGLKVGESAIVLATAEHLKALEQRLDASGVDVTTAVSQDQYITMIAEEALAEFMVNQWPDDNLFANFVTSLITRAQVKGRRVRAFGELVALLWARGDVGATVRLEFLWHQLCRSQSFSLFCAYPKSGFTEDPLKSLDVIRATHSRII
jgi:DcmR-like sensory protein